MNSLFPNPAFCERCGCVKLNDGVTLCQECINILWNELPTSEYCSNCKTEKSIKEWYLCIKCTLKKWNEYCCSFCKRDKVEKIQSLEPFLPDYWLCSSCDSTYSIDEYPRKIN